jgi:hypothetical protein
MTEALVSAMSNVDQYAASVVEEYHVAADTESPSHRAADELIPLIKQWGKQYLQGITLSGPMRRIPRSRSVPTWMC